MPESTAARPVLRALTPVLSDWGAATALTELLAVEVVPLVAAADIATDAEEELVAGAEPVAAAWVWRPGRPPIAVALTSAINAVASTARTALAAQEEGVRAEEERRTLTGRLPSRTEPHIPYAASPQNDDSSSSADPML